MQLGWWYHNHKKLKDSLETQTVLGNGPNHQESFYKNSACSKGYHPLKDTFDVAIEKKRAGMVQSSKKRNWEWNVNDNMLNR